MFRESSAVTIDPGFNTGIASWDGFDLLNTSIKKANNTTNDRLNKSVDLVNAIVEDVNENYTNNIVVIEGVEVWQSIISQTAAARGDLSCLSYIVGMLVSSFVNSEYSYSDIFVVNPSVWKAQLTYKALAIWVKRILHEEYNTEHELAAVGIGLFCQGRLH